MLAAHYDETEGDRVIFALHVLWQRQLEEDNIGGLWEEGG